VAFTVKGEGYERPANRKDAQPSETIMQQICTVNGFIFTDTPRAERIPKRLFFFLRCREHQQNNNNKSFVPTSPGSRETLFFFSFIYLFNLIY